MRLVRWTPFESMTRVDPYRSLADLRSEMNRLFGGFFESAGGALPGAQNSWAPMIDMYATPDDLKVVAELPGVPDKEIQVSVLGDVLSIKGQRHAPETAKDTQYYQGERWFGQFERHVSLPFAVDPSKVTAAVRDGVLTVTLPKAEQVKPKSVKVDVL